MTEQDKDIPVDAEWLLSVGFRKDLYDCYSNRWVVVRFGQRETRLLIDYGNWSKLNPTREDVRKLSDALGVNLDEDEKDE